MIKIVIFFVIYDRSDSRPTYYNICTDIVRICRVYSCYNKLKFMDHVYITIDTIKTRANCDIKMGIEYTDIYGKSNP